MGTPINTLVCASNKNNVLTEFLETGRYNKNRTFHTTMSPSMDILISSNLERLLYLTLGTEKTRYYMEKLNGDGEYTLEADELLKIKESFVGYYTDENMTAETVKAVYNEKNHLIDTHTAVAASAAMRYVSENKAKNTMLVVSTASAYKFASDVLKSLTGNNPSDEIEALSELSSFTGTNIPAPLKNLVSKKILHATTIKKEEMDHAVVEFAKA
jgi:threonine synthase